MKHVRSLLIMLPLIACCGLAFAQKKVITGRLTDQSTGDPLAGVTIMPDNSKSGTTSRQDGTYSISVEPNAAFLTFSYVGYNPQTISISGKSAIDVSLTAGAATVENEVVV